MSKNNLIQYNKKKIQPVISMVLIDFIILSIILFLPSFSHLLPFPLYLIEPMRIITVVGYLFSNKNNGLIIAMITPIFSSITSGHPIFLKASLIL